MTWHLRRLGCFDVESSGTDPWRDRIVTAAVVLAGGGSRTQAQSWLVNPGIEIPQGAIDVHGITNEKARTKGQRPANASHQIALALIAASAAGAPIVGHNLSYDMTMLVAELTRHGHDDLAGRIRALRPVIDTRIIEQHLDPYRPKAYNPNGRSRRAEAHCGSHTLVDCCRLWDIDLSADDAHGAEADALAAGRLAWRLATDPNRFADYDWNRGSGGYERINPASMTADELHDWEIPQYEQEALRYQSYVRGHARGKPDVIDPRFVASCAWPIAETPDGWTPDQLPAQEAVPA